LGKKPKALIRGYAKNRKRTLWDNGAVKNGLATGGGMGALSKWP